MNTQPKNRFYVLIIALFIFVSFITLACGGNGCGDTVSMDSPQCQPQPQNIIMGDALPIEQQIQDALAGDNPQNTLSNP
jgi:hypothetical protein